jgi:crossover junction endodeoxyribonuclease RuvC
LIILGVDPGSHRTGFGCIRYQRPQVVLLDHGTLNASGKEDLFTRLFHVCAGFETILSQLRPQVIAIEKVFFAQNALSALALGQIRGALIVTGKRYNCEIVEYSATQVKSAIAGHGRAEKLQVQKFLTFQFGSQNFTSLDASDGLALAVCHSLHLTSKRPFIAPSQNKSTSLAQSVAHKIPLPK